VFGVAKLQSLEFLPLNVELNEPFGIATGAHHAVHNVLVRLTLDDGTIGIGEAAPVPHISGETDHQVLAAAGAVRARLASLDLSRYRYVSAHLGELLSELPSARAGVEIALLDALTKRARLPLWKFFGGATTELITDITIPTGTVAHAATSAARAQENGFLELKIKIGGSNVELDLQRIFAVAEAAPSARLILDGNTAFDVEEAICLIGELGRIGTRVVLFEQPVEAANIEGLREVEASTGVAVAADESLRSLDDLRQIVRLGGISAVNIKTAKFGVIQAWDLLQTAKSLGLQVMMGGMVETEISMTTSACLAAGAGGVRFVDLDTPLFLANSPCTGGFAQTGPRLDLSPIAAGHGVGYSSR
jgi:L-Ala-D/L-Glu epimerase